MVPWYQGHYSIKLASWHIVSQSCLWQWSVEGLCRATCFLPLKENKGLMLCWYQFHYSYGKFKTLCYCVWQVFSMVDKCFFFLGDPMHKCNIQICNFFIVIEQPEAPHILPCLTGRHKHWWEEGHLHSCLYVLDRCKQLW